MKAMEPNRTTDEYDSPLLTSTYHHLPIFDVKASKTSCGMWRNTRCSTYDGLNLGVSCSRLKFLHGGTRCGKSCAEMLAYLFMGHRYARSAALVCRAMQLFIAEQLPDRSAVEKERRKAREEVATCPRRAHKRKEGRRDQEPLDLLVWFATRQAQLRCLRVGDGRTACRALYRSHESTAGQTSLACGTTSRMILILVFRAQAQRPANKGFELRAVSAGP